MPEAPDSLELELEAAVSLPDVSAGNITQVLCESRMCS